MCSESCDLSQAYNRYIKYNAGTTHMAIVFNIFVIYTLFNQFNCLVIDESLNIFIKITSNCLTLIQWLIVIGFSAITFVFAQK